MIKLIVFDLWRTLAYREVSYRTTAEILRLFHPHLSKRKLVKVFENSTQTKVWKSEYKAFENLCKNLGIGTDREIVNLLISIRDYANSRTKLYTHVKSMLKQLKKKKYKIGLLSNSSVFDVDYVKKATHLLKFIDYPLFSYDVGVIKPNLKFFKEMLRRAKCKPQETIMIGDKLNDDVTPARNIGMNAILFKNYRQLKKELSSLGISID